MKATSKVKLALFLAKNKKWLVPLALVVVAAVVYFAVLK